MQQDQSANLTDKEVIDNYLKDETVKNNHLKIAELLSKEFRDNWFTINQIIKKTKIKDVQQAHQMMLGLHLFGLSTSKEENKLVKFKITITAEERIKVLEDHKQNHLKQIELLDKEIEQLKVKG